MWSLDACAARRRLGANSRHFGLRTPGLSYSGPIVTQQCSVVGFDSFVGRDAAQHAAVESAFRRSSGVSRLVERRCNASHFFSATVGSRCEEVGCKFLKSKHAVRVMAVNFGRLPGTQIYKPARLGQHIEHSIDVVHKSFACDCF